VAKSDEILKASLNPRPQGHDPHTGIAFRCALRNLIENALRYAGDAIVTYQTQQQSLAITIKDAGPGISEG